MADHRGSDVLSAELLEISPANTGSFHLNDDGTILKRWSRDISELDSAARFYKSCPHPKNTSQRIEFKQQNFGQSGRYMR